MANTQHIDLRVTEHAFFDLRVELDSLAARIDYVGKLISEMEEQDADCERELQKLRTAKRELVVRRESIVGTLRYIGLDVRTDELGLHHIVVGEAQR